MPATFSRTLRSLSVDRPRRWMVAAALLLLAVWAAWFLTATVPVYEVTDNARLEVEAAAHPVASEVDGRVLKSNLSLGREVNAGDLLVELDEEGEQLALRERSAQREGLAARLQSLRGQISAEREAAAQHRAARAAALGESASKVEEAEARARSAEFQLETVTRLRSRNSASPEEYQRAQREAEALRAAVKTQQLAGQRLSRERDVEEGDRQARIAGLEADAAALEGQIATEEAAAQRIHHSIDLRRIRAAVSGRVGELSPGFREGSVVRIGEKLAAIVPPGVPRCVAMFQAASVGRIRPGQPARLRLQGYPWIQYGTVRARVTGVGNEATEGLIRVELTLAPDPNSPIPLTHGLPGSAEVQIERVAPCVLVLRAAGHYLAARRIANAPVPPPDAAEGAP